MSKHLLMPHHPKRRGKTRSEVLFERLLDAPATQRALGSHRAQRVLLGPEVVPALWGALILTGALGIAGFISQIPWNVQ